MDTASVDSGGEFPIELGFAERVLPDDTEGIAICSTHWPDWDGGKAGGKPVWLHPAALPAPSDLTCAHCSRPMVLLTQLYAPVDDSVVPHDGAYHRMLYVFSCARGECVNRASGESAMLKPSVVVLRCQLPQGNSFHKGKNVAIPPALLAPTCVMCGLAGPQRCSRCRTARYCSKAHQMLHWKAGHKEACRAEGASDGNVVDEGTGVAAACVLPLHELVIEREPGAGERREREVGSLPTASAQALRDMDAGKGAGAAACEAPSGAAAAAARRAKGAAGEDGEDGEGEGEGGEGAVDESQLSIDDLTQKALVETTGARLFSDDVMRYFQRRVGAEPSQVVRYCRWPSAEATAPALPATLLRGAPSVPVGDETAATGNGGEAGDGNLDDDDEELEVDADGEPFGAPLWLTAANQPSAAGDVPPCQRCGAPRAFEFQVMPQLLNFVNPEADSELRERTAALLGSPDAGIDLDFGTIAVYTCTASCADASGSQPYVPEVAWVQPMREEPAPEGTDGGHAGGGTGQTIMHEALRRVQDRGVASAPGTAASNSIDGPAAST